MRRLAEVVGWTVLLVWLLSMLGLLDVSVYLDLPGAPPAARVMTT